MSFFPYMSLFSSTLILGSLISLSASNWLLIWIGLELNLLSFVPLISFSNMNKESEASMKYFLSQALGSGLLLLGSINLYFLTQTMLPSFLSSFFIIIGLLIKLGMPPCHFWFPSVMNSISWTMCIILSTWQKIVPLFIIIYLLSSTLSINLISFILICSLISGLGGINQTQMKPLLAYSSIGHMAWMIGASMSSFSSSFSYFLIYCLISSALMLIFISFSFNSIISMNQVSGSPFMLSFSIFIILLSLGGIPPFLGFFPKWLVIQNLSSSSFILPMILLIGSMINLSYYLNIAFISFMTSNKSFLLSPNMFNYIFLISVSSFTFLLVPAFLFSLYAMTFLN